jgi:hypothetical protein
MPRYLDETFCHSGAVSGLFLRDCMVREQKNNQ